MAVFVNSDPAIDRADRLGGSGKRFREPPQEPLRPFSSDPLSAVKSSTVTGHVGRFHHKRVGQFEFAISKQRLQVTA
jgi:hypothetical protein